MEFKPDTMNVLYEHMNAYNIYRLYYACVVVYPYFHALEIWSYSNFKFVSLVNTSLGSWVILLEDKSLFVWS